MNRRPGGLLPIGLVAVGAIIYSLLPGGSSGSGAPTPSAALAAAASQAPASPVGDDPLRILDDFLDAKTGNAAAPPPTPRNLSVRIDEALHSKVEKGEPPKSAEPASAGRYSVTFLIAMVPDPIDSHLVQMFDRAVDSIQRGMEHREYVLDRFSLPWKKDTQTRWLVNANPSDPESFLTVNPRSGSDLHRRRPGALLFRGARKPEKLLVVYLVGETPTFGIQREAMSSALDAVDRCRSPVRSRLCDCRDTEIRILGPFYSGSTRSLRNSLVVWKNPSKLPVRILSGSATVESNKGELTLSSPHSTFAATVVPDLTLRKTFYRFLNDHIEPTHGGEVALFVEGGTVYGSSARPPAEAESGRKSGEKRESDEKRGSEDPVEFTIPFPLHVSALRGAYEQDTSLKSGGFFSRGPRHALELPLEAPEQNTRDILPPQDPKMTANVADLVLAAGIETIRRERIHLVGIVASDTRDILFLARRIRESEASVTLFTYGSDILYAHPDYQRYLRGMLVVTPYPLFWLNQEWTGAGRIRIPFSGSPEEGIYNAVLELAREKEEPAGLLEYRAPFIEGAPPRPPIWVMAVGRQGFWPVWYTSGYSNDSGYVYSPSPDTLPDAPGPRPEDEERPPGAELAFFLIQVLFLLMLVLCFGTRFWWSRKNIHVPEPLHTLARLLRGTNRRFEILFSAWSDRTARGVREAYLFILFFVFLLVQATLTAYLSAVREFLEKGDGAFFAAAALLALLLLAAALEYATYLRQSRTKWRCALVLVVSLWTAWPLGAYLAGIVRGLPGEEKSVAKLTLYARTLDLTSTVSPALPLFFGLALVCLWAIANIQRGFYLEVHGSVESPGQWNLKTLQGLRPIETAIRKLLGDPWTRAFAFLGPILVLLPFYRIALSAEYHTIDGAGWSLVFQRILLVGYFTTMYSITLFVLLWMRLRRLLKRLSCHPVAEAFQRLPESVAATPWKMWRALPSLTELSASVSQLRALINLGRARHDPFEKALAEQADIAEQQLERALRRNDQGQMASLPFQRALRKVMASAAVTVLPTLEGEWAKWPGLAEGIQNLDKAAPKQETLNTPAWIRRGIPEGQQIWIRAAEEFVALRMSEFIRHAFLQMKSLLTFAFSGFLLSIVAFNSYPFEPRRLIMALVWMVTLVALPVVAWVLLEMDRDPVLSYIGKTPPGHVTFSMELFTSMMIYVVVPLVTLFATQFPGVGDIVFSLINPAVKSLGK